MGEMGVYTGFYWVRKRWKWFSFVQGEGRRGNEDLITLFYSHLSTTSQEFLSQDILEREREPPRKLAS